jgi:Mobilization protein NikA
MQVEPARPPSAQMAGRKLYPKSTRVRLTDEEHRRLGDRAKQAGLSISRYLVKSALAQGVVKLETKEDTETRTFQRDWAINEVARVGNNLNQIARQLNSQRGSISSERIERALTEATAALNDVRCLYLQEDSQ